MTRKTRSLKWTALAIATAFIVAPAANSGGKLPNVSTSKVSTVSKQAAKAAKKQPAQYDRFIITYRSDAKKLSAAASRHAAGDRGQGTGRGHRTDAHAGDRQLADPHRSQARPARRPSS